MRVPLSWLRPLVPGLTAAAEEVATALIRAGLEVEQVVRVGHDVSGVVVGRVLDVELLTGHRKEIRYCHVDVGTRVREVVCGAPNVVAGALVPFALPGAVLPGEFRIAARQTYGRTSDGMICSAAELGLETSSDGILELADGEPGDDVVALLGLRDEVLDIAVTPDRGYALSIRGVAREVATAFGLEFRDPADLAATTATADGVEVVLADPGCTRYVARVVRGLDAAAPSPPWLRRRLTLAGMRPVSLAVDVTNHVMLETGQPLHAFDLDRLATPVVVRRAAAGETLRTLDGQDRPLSPRDLVISDGSGPVALAGVMGGEATEVTSTTTDLLLEAAHFDATAVARTARAHRLPSEASRRYERGVDPDLAAAAAQAAVDLLVRLGGAAAGPVSEADQRRERPVIRLAVDHPGRVAGRSYPPEVVTGRLADVGCAVTADGPWLQVVPPGWRPDLTGPADLVEEVIRLEGYDTVPSELPRAPAGRGLTEGQRHRRAASRALAAAGLVEVSSPPFVGDPVLESLGLGHLGPPRLVNPLSATESRLRPSLLPGLLAALARNVGRGTTDVAVFETGAVFRGSGTPVPVGPPVTRRPTGAELTALDAALPAQPVHAGLALTGGRLGHPAGAADAVECLVHLARSLGVDVSLAPAGAAPFHPGRCVALAVGGEVLGHAGELHPRVVEALDLPARTCAGELDLDRLVALAVAAGPVTAPVVSSFPPAALDVALVVADDVPAAEVEAALREGAGPWLESVRLFDVYDGPQVAAGHRSLAFSLRLRAPDRTLTDVDALAARDAAVAAATARTGARLRT